MPTNNGFFESPIHNTKHATDHPYNLQQALKRFECSYLQNILVLADGDVAHAAEMLGISPKTLSKKIKRYELVSKCRA